MLDPNRSNEFRYRRRDRIHIRRRRRRAGSCHGACVAVPLFAPPGLGLLRPGLDGGAFVRSAATCFPDRATAGLGRCVPRPGGSLDGIGALRGPSSTDRRAIRGPSSVDCRALRGLSCGCCDQRRRPVRIVVSGGRGYDALRRCGPAVLRRRSQRVGPGTDCALRCPATAATLRWILSTSDGRVLPWSCCTVLNVGPWCICWIIPHGLLHAASRG